MGVVLDTAVLIGAEREAFDLEALLEALKDEPVAISTVTASELLHGCFRARDPGARIKRLAYVEALLDVIPLLPFGLGEARQHAEVWAHLAAKGQQIGAHDMMIAATALTRAWRLATPNRKEFAKVPGLELLPVDRYLVPRPR